MSFPEVFNRKVCNMTGIDIRVPRHEEVEGPLGGTSVEYVINTILKLKIVNDECNEDEVSEYKSSKSFRECEDFFAKLHRQYAGVNLPELSPSSRKPSASLEERRKALDELFQTVASTDKICTCQLLLKFLSIDPSEKPKGLVPVPNNATEQELSSAVFEKVKLRQDIVDSASNKQTEPKNLFSDPEPDTPVAEEEDDDDIFRDSRKRNATGSKPLFDQLSLNTRNEKLVNREPLLFDSQDYGGPLSPDDEHLFLVPGAKRDISSDISIDSVEETADLLSLDDNMDDFLQQINQKKKKPPPPTSIATSPPPSTIRSVQPKPAASESQPVETPVKPATPAKPVIAAKPPTPVKPVLAAKPSLAPKPTPAARGGSAPCVGRPVPAARPVPKPRKRMVPPATNGTGTQASSVSVKKKEDNEDDGDIDILKYIEQEEKAGQTDISLFS